MAGADDPVVQDAFLLSQSGDVAKKGSTATVERRCGLVVVAARLRRSRRFARAPRWPRSCSSRTVFASPRASLRPIRRSSQDRCSTPQSSRSTLWRGVARLDGIQPPVSMFVFSAIFLSMACFKIVSRWASHAAP